MVHGAGAAQALLRAGQVDEMEIHLVPVLLGDGRRLFDHLGSDHIELDLVRRLEDRDVTHLRYRVHRPGGGGVKTLFVSYRVTDLNRSLGFYTALGYAVLGRVEVGDGARLVLLRFPDEPAASLELVHRPGDGPVDVGRGFDHLAIQVEKLATTLETLTEAGLGPEPLQYPGGPHGPKTSWLTDPDGYRIELVEWPSGHPDGITAADFA